MKRPTRFLALLLILLGSKIAHAHGGGALQLSNAPAGPYLVSVWTQTDVLRVGRLHVTVAVSQPAADDPTQAGEPVLDASVRVVAMPASGGPAIASEATTGASLNKLYYETDFDLPAAGVWQFRFEVEGPAGSGMATFAADVLPAANVGWPVFAAVAVVLALAAWLAQSRARAGGRTRSAPRRPGQAGHS